VANSLVRGQLAVSVAQKMMRVGASSSAFYSAPSSRSSQSPAKYSGALQSVILRVMRGLQMIRQASIVLALLIGAPSTGAAIEATTGGGEGK
jgi:hypothetical protein